MTPTTLATLTSALVATGRRRLRSDASRMAAKEIASRMIGPLVPAGTLCWLAFPWAGESPRAYASRAWETAAARSMWAGGLADGTTAYDAAVIQSVSRLGYSRGIAVY